MLLCVAVRMVRKFGDVVNLSKSAKCGHSITEHNTREYYFTTKRARDKREIKFCSGS